MNTERVAEILRKYRAHPEDIRCDVYTGNGITVVATHRPTGIKADCGGELRNASQLQLKAQAHQQLEDRLIQTCAETILAELHPVITTVDQLDALPEDTIIRDRHGRAQQRDPEGWASPDHLGHTHTNDPWRADMLPATLLYRGDTR